ncbi:hypothetical protein [Christiangramia sp. SM2212]|uniref:Uncharacterized protein n=1 Tax=Christiangramia sediminicola TaxID=3073267 RepID=A0ABU1ESG4_9FLAO|nr:hypothetical protein [Christiangramia sp. SM2212]MDR5591098.1 hypothetical protein [Christiangramia sp. SM2212]
MKTFKNLLILSIIILFSYSCEPEEMPQDEVTAVDNISATGDSKDEVKDRKGNS